MRSTSASWHKFLACILLSGFLAMTGTAQVSSHSGIAVPLITQPIDDSQTVTLTGNVSPIATPEADGGTAPDLLELGRTILVLKSSSQQQASLKQLMNDQQNPKSASYHKWLKPEQFGAQFGVAPQDLEKITQWLQSFGFQVEPPMAGNSLVMFSGTHSQLKAAFHTEIHSFTINGQSYWANATDPQIPAALAPVVAGFSSLNSFPRNALHTAPQLIRREGSSWKPAAGSKLKAEFTTSSNGQTINAIGPYDLATMYNFLPLWNAGIDGTDQTIAIVSATDIDPADVDYFRSTFGLPGKKLNLIYYGANPGRNQSEPEADLDVEWAGAVAKNATIDLVIAPNTTTSNGIDAAAAYIINNNLASIMNVSYGQCELVLGTAGNQYFSQLWEQAAAQGITVMVAAGDAGSGACEQNRPYAKSGLSVSGLASTPYNIAVGGTDLYSSFLSPNTYWNTTNDPTTLESALSYIPETPWNNSCASPEVFSLLQANGVADATPEALCNDPNEQPNFLTTLGGSGGASNCTTVNRASANECSGGHPKPAWQSGIPGIPGDGVRDLPDVSLMAGNGLWGSFYVYCESDVTPTGSCDVNNALEGAGGTSFASPIFAGMMALVQQETSSQQGNVNYVLYKLAATQFGGRNAASCTSANVTTGNACLFYDVTDGSNAVPCLAGSTSCTPAVSTDQYGILPGYDAAPGYDLATGLGSVNAYNLVEQWESAASTFLPSTTTIAASGSASAPYGSSISVAVTVAAAPPSSGTPSGDVGITTNSTLPSNNSVAEATLSNGQATIAATQLLAGTYQLFARYAGDATFSPSQSNGLSVTITPAAISGASLTASRSTVEPGQSVTVTFLIPGVNGGVNPTGTATITDATTGAVLSSGPVNQGPSSSGTPSSSAYVTLSAAQLQSGVNSITASYSGDSNYGPATATSLVVTSVGAFTTNLSPAALTLAPNAGGSVTVTVAPNGNTTLNPSSLSFSCPATLPAGLTCSFSAPVATTGGSVTSTLTLQLASPLFVKTHKELTSQNTGRRWPRAGIVASLAGLMMLGISRRRRAFTMWAAIVLCSLSIAIGCGGSGSSTKTPPALIATTTTLSSSASQPALNSPVILTAKVAPTQGSGTPTGTISFASGSASLGTANLASGSASLTVSSLPVGTQAISASYGGDSSYANSSSSATSVDVTYSTTIAVTAKDAQENTSSATLALTVQ
jgi:Pro-kumamolisin, activation domain/Bacterial Ig-like domain (group 3)